MSSGIDWDERSYPYTDPRNDEAASEVLIAIDTAGIASRDVDIRRHPDSIKNSRFPLVHFIYTGSDYGA